jgi:putative transposase
MDDFQELLEALPGPDAPNLPPSVIARLRRCAASGRQTTFVGRDATCPPGATSPIWANGVYLRGRMEPQIECMLVLIGATPEGKKELLGFWEALDEVSPHTRHQRCTVHKTATL